MATAGLTLQGTSIRAALLSLLSHRASCHAAAVGTFAWTAACSPGWQYQPGCVLLQQAWHCRAEKTLAQFKDELGLKWWYRLGAAGLCLQAYSSSTAGTTLGASLNTCHLDAATCIHTCAGWWPRYKPHLLLLMKNTPSLAAKISALALIAVSTACSSPSGPSLSSCADCDGADMVNDAVVATGN